ncbi:nucleolar rRNA processing GAR1 [Fusarium pseudoanthophilum]|uniref:Nucleolar rRNA processing GAR1 n=1 Tax=Fusarium pseudoanthophilum TaxID=48495 RepID=A0A8H5KJR3_9HYPO|nr:nucleolar rRNA processing GAR1 [Fusarium pseudoanthophilum]
MAAPRAYNNPGPGYLQNGAGGLPPTGAAPLLPNQGRVLQTGPLRVLCIADVRGNLRSLNDLAKQARADHIIHTGDFGFYDDTSLERIAEKTLKHVAQYSPLISEPVKKAIQQGGPGPVKSRFPPNELPLSELPLLISGEVKLDVPVYTVWGACEDVRVLEKFRTGEYKVPNLHIIDEARSMLLEVGGVKLRLLGLGGAVVMHKLFDNGEGRTTIAGGQGTMWTTLLQMGELVDTAHRVYDPTETRIFITHASPAREGILNQLSVTLKADFSISAGLHFRYGSSYNEFSVNPTLDHYRGKLAASKASFNDVWETVKSEVEPAIQQNEAQQNLLKNALQIVEKMPTTAAGGNPFGGPAAGQASLGQVDESAFKNMWNFNLADAAFGYLVLEIQDGRIGTEMRAQGFNFSHRGAKQQPGIPPTTAGPAGIPSPAPPSTQSSVPPPTSRQPSTVQAAKPAVATPLPGPLKPATPQPAPSSNSPAPAPPSKDTEKATAPASAPANGSAHPERVSSPAPKTPASDIIGLFIMNVNTEDQCRDLFSEEDKNKILKVDKWGNSNKVVQFKTTEDRDAALARLPEDVKTRTQEDRSKPLVKIFQHREGKTYANRGGAGNWGASGRGGATNTSGYRSAGGASDSESNRRGGRGGRGRGGDRGRGGRGRGGLKGETGTSSPAAAPATPAAD